MTDIPAGFGQAGHRLHEDELGVTRTASWTPRDLPSRTVLLTVYHAVVTDRAQRRKLRSALAATGRLCGRPGLLAALDTGFTAAGHPYLATEFAGSATLGDALAAQGPLPAGQVARIGAELGLALGAAHADGVLHLDVRPRNLWLDDVGRVALRGMGAVRGLRAVLGIAVPAPLQVHAPRELFGWETPSPRTDVYQLGSTLYELLAGQPAYAADARLGQAALYQRVLRADPPRLARTDVPESLRALLRAMMAADAADRPALDEVRAVLDEVVTATGPGWHRPAGEPAPEPVVEPEPVVPEPVPVSPVGIEPAPATAEVPAAAVAHSEPDPVDPPQPATPPTEQKSAESMPLADSSEPDPACAPAVTGPEPTEAAEPPAAPETVTHPDVVLTLDPAAVAQVTADPPQEPEPVVAPAIPAPRESERTHSAHRYLGLGLLIGVGLVAMGAGVVWGAVTDRHPVAAVPPPAATTAPVTPRLLPEPQADQYRVTGVTVTPGANGTLISWQPPTRTDRAALFVIVAELNSRPVSQQEVGPGGRSVAFTDLPAHQDFCFSVTTVVEQTSGTPGMTTTQPVCGVTG